MKKWVAVGSAITTMFVSILLIINSYEKQSENPEATKVRNNTMTMQAEDLGEKFVRVKDNPARLVQEVTDGNEIVLIIVPVGIELKVMETEMFRHRQFNSWWYRVEYKNQVGWISEDAVDKFRKK